MGNPKVREVEEMLLRTWPLNGALLVKPSDSPWGGGILVVNGLRGEVFKIEITQVDGPQ